MTFELRIALRFLASRRRRRALSFVSWIAVGGVALGVLALIVVLSVMTGFQLDLRDRLVGADAQIMVTRPKKEPLLNYRELRERILAIQDVVEVSPFFDVKAMIRAAGFTGGIELLGIDPANVAGIGELPHQLVQGRLENLLELQRGIGGEPAVPGIILGEILATDLRVFPGERIQLLIPGAISTPLGRKPRIRTFQVVGIFRTRLYEYDSSRAYARLEDAWSLAGARGGVTGLGAKVSELELVPGVASEIKRAISPDLRVRDWRQMNAAFFSALELEKWAMFVILCLIVVVASFNIVSTLTMKVMEKSRDIGVLRALGATEHSILAVFVIEGLWIGILGTILGTYLGVSLCYLADAHHLITSAAQVYDVAYLPFKTQPVDVLIVCFASVSISFLTAIPPSLQAMHLDPILAIRGDS